MSTKFIDLKLAPDGGIEVTYHNGMKIMQQAGPSNRQPGDPAYLPSKVLEIVTDAEDIAQVLEDKHGETYLVNVCDGIADLLGFDRSRKDCA